MRYHHALDIPRFPPRVDTVLQVGALGVVACVAILQLPEFSAWFTDTTRHLLTLFALVLGAGFLGLLFAPTPEFPLWGRVAELSKPEIQARLDRAAEIAVAHLGGGLAPTDTVTLYLHIEPRSICLWVDFAGDTIPLSRNLGAHLAQQIVPAGTDGRALVARHAYIFQSKSSDLFSARIRPADLSAHQRLAHLHRYQTADGPGPASQGTLAPEKEIA